MLATKLESLVNTEAVRKEMAELLELARKAGADEGYLDLRSDFAGRVEPRLALLRERIFSDSAAASEARGRRLQELTRRLLACEERIGEYRDEAVAEAAPSGLRRRWPQVASVAAAAVLAGLAMEEAALAPVTVRSAAMLGLAAALAILNLDFISALPGRMRARWQRWRTYRAALGLSRTCRREIERLEREDLERAWVRQWADQWIGGLRGALAAEHDFQRQRASLARG